MNTVRKFDLGSLKWTLSGFTPNGWMGKSLERGFIIDPEFPPVPAKVPGSVQGVLREAGTLQDFFEGLNSLNCEWIEHRDWVFETTLPDEWFKIGKRFVLNCGGLDGNGVIVFNKKQVGTFDNAYIPYEFDLSEHVLPAGNKLHLIFCLPPRWLGLGYTSQIKDWKPRFNYTWDWTPRIVQLGPWEPVSLEVSDGLHIESLNCRSGFDLGTSKGLLFMKGTLDGLSCSGCKLSLSLIDGKKLLKKQAISVSSFENGVSWSGIEVEAWWPNGSGRQPLYKVVCELHDAKGVCLDKQERTVGFKHVEWRQCENAPAGADPWICAVNGKPIFLQGVNWTPIRPTFADLKEADFKQLISQYKELGCNIFRVWGGAVLEKECFYDLCDRLGILVWQEFPLSSSGHENWPPEGEAQIDTLVRIAESYIIRRRHHVSLLMWCGGNELQGSLDGGKVGAGLPVTLKHPLMERFNALIESEDTGRRFVPSSSSGPRFLAGKEDFGKGLHWDVHGPWTVAGDTPEEAAAYWANDDALFRSEVGAPGASSAELIRRYSNGLSVTPGTSENMLWRRFPWWGWKDFTKELGREPSTLEEFVAWSQKRQADALFLAVDAAKKRFPGIGGMIIWMGHDSFPCPSNTAIIDFHGNPKPAALAISQIWKSDIEKLKHEPND